MKEVRVCEAMKSPVGTSSDGTVLHQQDGGTKSRQVPIWEKSNLTLEEAKAAQTTKKTETKNHTQEL